MTAEPLDDHDGTAPLPGQPRQPLEVRVHRVAVLDAPVAHTVIDSAVTVTPEVEVAVSWHYPLPDPDDPTASAEPYVVVEIDTTGKRDAPTPVKVYMNDSILHNALSEDGL